MGIREVLKKSSILTGIASFFLLLFGISGAILAGLGTCIFCLIPVLTFLLSIFGLSIAVIADYNIYFIIFGVLMFGVTLFFALNRKRFNCKDGQCKVKPVKKKKTRA